MAAPTSGLLETAPGGLPLVAQSGLNTAKASNFAGVTIDTSGNTAIPGTATLSGAVTQKSNFISGSGATVTLTAAQSGSTILFDRAAGIVYTLPAPAVGLWFEFVATVSVTSNAYKIITDAGTTLLIGSIYNAVAAGTGTTFIGNGTTHISVSQSGTTTGGLVGTSLVFTCVSSTLWEVQGVTLGSGTVATPFATS